MRAVIRAARAALPRHRAPPVKARTLFPLRSPPGPPLPFPVFCSFLFMRENLQLGLLELNRSPPKLVRTVSTSHSVEEACPPTRCLAGVLALAAAEAWASERGPTLQPRCHLFVPARGAACAATRRRGCGGGGLSARARCPGLHRGPLLPRRAGWHGATGWQLQGDGERPVGLVPSVRKPS